MPQTPRELAAAAQRSIELKAAAAAAPPASPDGTNPAAPADGAPDPAGPGANESAAKGTDLAAQIADLGTPSPGADPVGVFGFLTDPTGWLQAWVDTSGDAPVGYIRTAFDPQSAVRVDDLDAWTAAVEKFGMGEQPTPTAPTADDGGGEPVPNDTPVPPASDGPDSEPDTPADGGKEEAPAKAGTKALDTTPAGGPSDDEDPGEHTGVMIALMVEAGTAGDMALSDDPHATPADELHITLAYLGSSEDYDDEADTISRILEAVREVADRHDVVTGQISGVGRFATPDGDAFYLSYDAPDLPSLRQDLMEALTDAGLEPSMDHGFSPHITLTYLTPGNDAPLKRVDVKPLTFPAITLVFGAHTSIATPLGQPLDETEADTWSRTVDGMTLPDSTAPSANPEHKGFPPRKGKGGPPIANGSWVSWSGGKGRVDLMVTNGAVPGVSGDVEGSTASPAARVVIYEADGGSWKSTGRKVGVKVATLKRIPPLSRMSAKSVAADLTALLADYQDRIETKGAGAPVDASTLREVHRRGAASWPGPQVTDLDADTWGCKRAEAFLEVAGGGHYPGYHADRDLLPGPVVEVKVQPVQMVPLTGPDPRELAAELRRIAAG